MLMTPPFINLLLILNQTQLLPAIAATQIWSEQNSMTLNAEKTEITNVFLNYRNRYDDDVLVNDVCIKPTVNGKHLKRLLM